jgi:hypothetical protein
LLKLFKSSIGKIAYPLPLIICSWRSVIYKKLY